MSIYKLKVKGRTKSHKNQMINQIARGMKISKNPLCKTLKPKKHLRLSITLVQLVIKKPSLKTLEQIFNLHIKFQILIFSLIIRSWLFKVTVILKSMIFSLVNLIQRIILCMILNKLVLTQATVTINFLEQVTQTTITI